MPAKTQNRSETALEFRWDDIRVLLALARAGTLSGAGADLGVNASTVGRRLSKFEAAIDTRLFDRTPDGVLPTEALLRLLPHASELELAAADISRAVEGLEREPEGVVRLTTPPGVAHLFVAPALAEFNRRYPKIQLEIDASVAYLDLTRREADIALRVMRPSIGDLVAVRIGDEPQALLTSSSYADELGTLCELDDARWIGWGRDLAHISAARWIGQHVSPASLVLRSSNITTQIEAARGGLGVILGPLVMARASGLCPVELSPALRVELERAPHETLWLVGHRALREVPRIAVVWEFIVELMQGFAV